MFCRTLLIFVALGMVPSTAATLFISQLSGANTNPPNGSTAYGTGTITISDDQTFLSATLSMSNLTSLPTLAGIFGPRYFSSPLFLSVSLISNGPASYFGSASTAISPQFVSDLRAGNYFFNVFTEAYPAGAPLQGAPSGSSSGSGGAAGSSSPSPIVYTGGEASGDISEVPEPGTAMLVLMGVLVFFCTRKS